MEKLCMYVKIFLLGLISGDLCLILTNKTNAISFSLDGNFSAWKYGPCSVGCVDETGVLIRKRYCDSPKPGNYI